MNPSDHSIAQEREKYAEMAGRVHFLKRYKEMADEILKENASIAQEYCEEFKTGVRLGGSWVRSAIDDARLVRARLTKVEEERDAISAQWSFLRTMAAANTHIKGCAVFSSIDDFHDCDCQERFDVAVAKSAEFEKQLDQVVKQNERLLHERDEALADLAHERKVAAERQRIQEAKGDTYSQMREERDAALARAEKAERGRDLAMSLLKGSNVVRGDDAVDLKRESDAWKARAERMRALIVDAYYYVTDSDLHASIDAALLESRAK